MAISRCPFILGVVEQALAGILGRRKGTEEEEAVGALGVNEEGVEEEVVEVQLKSRYSGTS